MFHVHTAEIVATVPSFVAVARSSSFLSSSSCRLSLLEASNPLVALYYCLLASEPYLVLPYPADSSFHKTALCFGLVHTVLLQVLDPLLRFRFGFRP